MSDRAVDPVCGMEVDKEQAAATAQQAGETYYFCAESCREKFEQNPEHYVGES